VFQGFKDWKSLSTVWLLTSFIFSFAVFFFYFAAFFFFFIAFLGHTHFILVITFFVIWACPLAFEFLGLFCILAFLTALSSFLIIEISICPQCGVWSYSGFFMKEKLFKLKKGSQWIYLFQNVKGITKMVFPHFKRKQLRSINFDLI